MITHDQYLEAIEIIQNYQRQEQDKMVEINIVAESVNKLITPNSLIIHVKMKPRSFNILARYFLKVFDMNQKQLNNSKVKILEKVSESEIYKMPGVGKTSVAEIKQILSDANLKMQR